jgi:hypothetical protein
MVYAVLWEFIEANYSAQETRGWLLRSGEYEYWDPEAQQHVAFLCLIRENTYGGLCYFSKPSTGTVGCV